MNPQSLLETLSRLRALPREAATVEFKSNLEEPSEASQYLSAMANAAACGGTQLLLTNAPPLDKLDTVHGVCIC